MMFGVVCFGKRVAMHSNASCRSELNENIVVIKLY